jgi:hypothetical protein
MNTGNRENELKFVIGNQYAGQVLKWLSCHCLQDPIHPTGTVSSIYYDTRSLGSLYEKINSDYLKTKVRLRWYADIGNTRQGRVSFVEAKHKIGHKRKKNRLQTPHSGDWLANIDLENTRLLSVPLLLLSVGVNLRQPLFPACHIRYKRYRFIEKSTAARVCFDCDIAVPRINRLLVPRHHPCMLQTAVFEIKGDTQKVPEPLGPIMRLGFKKASFSKYGACFEKMTAV